MAYGTLGAARRDVHVPDGVRVRSRRRVGAGRLRQAFHFPDDEALIEAEFRKNVPFALATARSAPTRTTRSRSSAGRQAPEFVVDSFDVSYGDPQTVAVTARRDQHNRRLDYRVNGGRTHRAPRARVERRRALRRRARRLLRRVPRQGDGRPRPATRVEVWFTARRDGRHVESEHFTYTVASDSGRRRADRRQRGLHRRQPHVPRRHGRAEVRRRVRRRPRRQRHHARHLGRRRPGRPAPARRAQPLRRRGVGERRRPARAGPRGRRSPTRSCSDRSPTSPWPSASST